MEYRGSDADMDQPAFSDVLDVCHEMRAELNCDFAAIAIQDDIGTDINGLMHLETEMRSIKELRSVMERGLPAK